MLLKTSFRNTKGDETTRKRKIKLKKSKVERKDEGRFIDKLGSLSPELPIIGVACLLE